VTRTRIKIFASTKYQDLEDKMNKYLEETDGYLSSIKYSVTAASNGVLHCSALIRYEIAK